MSDVNLMADASHTPGPWRFDYNEGDKSSEIVAKDDRICEPICIVPHDDITEEGERVVLANARLIAAAPDMLWKLRELAAECAECAGTGKEVRYMNGIQHEVSCRECDDIRKVIAKAQGRS